MRSDVMQQSGARCYSDARAPAQEMMARAQIDFTRVKSAQVCRRALRASVALSLIRVMRLRRALQREAASGAPKMTTRYVALLRVRGNTQRDEASRTLLPHDMFSTLRLFRYAHAITRARCRRAMLLRLAAFAALRCHVCRFRQRNATLVIPCRQRAMSCLRFLSAPRCFCRVDHTTMPLPLPPRCQ